MGSAENEPGRDNDETLHTVQLTHPFLIGETEVTRSAFAQLVSIRTPAATPCTTDDCPVDQVSWFEAIFFANELSRLEGLEPCYRLDLNRCTGTPASGRPKGLICDDGAVTWKEGYDCKGYRLPTEAEWEYAARAGTQTAWYNGDSDLLGCDPDSPIAAIGWYCANRVWAAPVAQLKPNNWGLYDMAGNLREWCWDRYFGDYSDRFVIDPLGSVVGMRRSRRGGGLTDTAKQLRSANRMYSPPNMGVDHATGFRLVRSL